MMRGASRVAGSLGALAVVGALAALGACGGSKAISSSPRPSSTGGGETGELHVAGGHYARADVERAVAAERETLAQIEQRIADAEAHADPRDDDAPVKLAPLRADATARAAYLAQLQGCLGDSAPCPPSLDEPAIDADYDPATQQFRTPLASVTTPWIDVATRLEAHACACRTSACVGWVMADLDRYEAAVAVDAQADEAAEAHVVGARDCLWTRLGKRAVAAAHATDSAGGGAPSP